MKKLLLLLLFITGISIYAQPPGLLNPYSVCDDGIYDGYTTFNLTATDPIGSLGLNPAAYTVTFHPSVADANNNVNVIANPSAYINEVPYSQTIGIRFLNTSTSEVAVSGMVLTVNPAPTANPAALYFCDTFELPIYNLSDANAQITGGNTGVIVTYHVTLTDAQTGANPAGPGYAPIVTPVQTLYARVQSPETGCYSITTLTLNSHNCIPCQDSAPINLTANNVTDTTLLLSWETTYGMGNQASLISIVPYGTPPSETGTVSVMTIQNSQMITSLQSESCYSIYMKGFCSSGYSHWSAPLNICMPNCANASACQEGLVLDAFLDSNNNGVKDSGEINFNGGNFVYQVNNNGANQYGASNNDPYYIFDSNPTNSYDISFATNSELAAYYTSSVTYNDVTLPDGSGLHYLNFPVVNTQPYADAAVYLHPSSGRPRPGFTYEITIYYKNNGMQPIDGTLTFTKHPTITIAAISQSGATITPDGFSYNFTNIPPLGVRNMTVTLSVPLIPLVNLGDYLTNTVTIAVNNDVNTLNNNAYDSQIVVGSYDPNDKSEAHGGKIVHSTFTANDYLYYTVQFENTGSASADFIRVEDALDSQLDENSFEMIAASHNVNTKRVGNQLTWHFYDINLPPTSSNPNGSHGYFSFKIKPKTGYAIGDIIPNTASIYFDYNPAIVTNRFDTEFVQALGNPTFNADTISLYPNPTSDMFSISNSNGDDKIASVSIYDVSGKRIYTLNKNTLNNISVNVSNFARGLYLVELTSENNTKITKKLLLK